MRKKSLRDLSKRLLYSSLAMAIVAIILIFSNLLLVKGVFFLFISTIAIFAIWEFRQMLKLKKIYIEKGVLEFGALFTVFSFAFSCLTNKFHLLPLLVLLLMIFLFFSLYFKKQSEAIVSVSCATFGLIYIAFPISLFFPLVYCSPMYDGRWWVVYLLGVTKIFDVVAYFGGRLYGKRKLAPKISPNKTIEGALFGLISSAFLSLFFSYLGNLNIIDFSLSYQRAIVLGPILGMMGQVGDLSESLFKRDAGVKDSNTLPGVGGVLDMVDSLLFTTPILYFYLSQQSVL